MQDLAGCDYFRTPVNFQLSDIFVFVGDSTDSDPDSITGRVEDGRGSVKPRFPSPLIKPDMRSYRIRLSDWLHLKAHDVPHISSVSVAVRQVHQILAPMETDGCLANAPYAD